MAGGNRDINIFRVLSRMEDAWRTVQAQSTLAMPENELGAWREEQRRFFLDGKDVRSTLLSEFREFLFSCEWTKSAVAKEIVGYVESGVSLSEIGDLVGLKNSAFRMRVARMTETVNGLLFGGRQCPEGVYRLTDLAAIKKCLLQIRLVRDPVDMNEEFSLRQCNWMKGHVDGVEKAEIGRENLDKYFQSVLFLALTSRSFVLNLLDEIDPSVLQYALSDFQSKGVNSTKLLFSLLLKHLTPESVACREELITAKKEYQEYMKG